MARWKIARVMGIDLFVHWSFLLAPLLVLALTWEREAPWSEQPRAVFAVVCLFAVFGCVVLHELGHARMARAFGIRTRDITIYLIGGVARLENMTEKPWEEFLIAIAGPAVNVVIAFLLLLSLLPLLPHLIDYSSGHSDLGFWPKVLVSLLGSNIILVLFNMLPAFPMDGGRVLRALLSLGMDHLRATETAVYVGMFMAGILGLLGLVLTVTVQNPSLLLVTMFVFAAGQRELAMTRRRYAMLMEEPIDVLPAGDDPPPPRLHGAEPGFSGMAWDVSRRAWVIWQDGRPVSSYGAKPE
jgi:Zn-dependent protease